MCSLFFDSRKLSFLESKSLRQDAHFGVQRRCRKRPPKARESAKTDSFLVYRILDYNVGQCSFLLVFEKMESYPQFGENAWEKVIEYVENLHK